VLKQRHQIFVVLLGLADALVITLACVLAWAVRKHYLDADFPPLDAEAGWRIVLRETLVLFGVPLGVVAMRAVRLYRPWRDRRLLAEAKSIANASLMTVVAMIVLLWALGPELVGGWNATARLRLPGVSLDAPRTQLLALAILLPVLLTLERAAFRAVLRTARSRGYNLRHVAVIGTGRLGRIACRTLDRNTWTGLHVAYFIDHHEHPHRDVPVVGRSVHSGLALLEETIERWPVDAVYLALPNNRASLMPGLLRRLERYPLDVRIIPDVSPRYVPLSMTINELEGMPILSIRESPLAGVAGAMKRAIDVCGALLGLLVFGVPMLAIALVIRASGDGPVIFRQKRVSLGGEEFDILKFRTMRHVEDEQAPASWTTREDPRITPIGRWLRCTSLDELPQLINVLLGDMSLVGPRPERPELILKFREDWRGYVLRQHVKAGITGWAQVNGLRGDTSLRKRLQLDLFYIRHWSLGFDLKILWLTLFRGFVHRNAH
jgi:Undecaprenyl-phosphate glucose phosphotransferase